MITRNDAREALEDSTVGDDTSGCIPDRECCSGYINEERDSVVMARADLSEFPRASIRVGHNFIFIFDCSSVVGDFCP
jgi:hypothetical protein